MHNLQEIQDTVLQDMAKAVSFYKSLGLTRDSDMDDIKEVAKQRAKEKFEDSDNDRTMKDLFKGQLKYLIGIKKMLQSREAYKAEYDKQVNNLRLEMTGSVDSQMNDNTKEHNQLSSKNSRNNFDLECEKYYQLMKELGYTDQKYINNYLTQEKKWDDFPIIRAINTHGAVSGIPGITPKAYAKICRLMNREISSGGQPLTHSERY